MLPHARPRAPRVVNCALLTAYKNAGGDIDLEEALKEGFSRGRK